MIYNEPGRCRKLCECGKYAHARSLKCEACGKTFTPKAHKAPGSDPGASQATKEPSQSTIKAKAAKAEPVAKPVLEQAILTPAGRCPVALTATDNETVLAWRQKVIQHFDAQGKKLSEEGVRYFVRQFFPMHEPVHQQITSFLAKEFAQKVV